MRAFKNSKSMVENNMDSKLRSIVKALSWRFIATSVTFIVAYCITGELTFAASIGLLDTIFKLALYFMHERLWEKITFGRVSRPEYEI